MELHPYLNFNGDCREAFTFYHQVLGGTIEAMLTHEGTPAAEHTAPEWLDKIMHARLVVDGAVLMASDVPPEYQTETKGFAVSLHVKETAEAERIFAALSEGGKVTLPIQATFWAERFAMFTDRFGIPWMINCEGNAGQNPGQ